MPIELRQPATDAPSAQGAMASANAAPNASNDHSRDIFEFFELPRELRDLIYGYAVDDKSCGSLCEYKSDSGTFELRYSKVARVDLLVVCRQFNVEYFEAVDKLDTLLEVFDLLGDIPSAEQIILPSPTSLRISSLALCITSDLDMTQGSSEIGTHKLWVDSILRLLPQLRRLTVTILAPVGSTCGWAGMRLDLVPWLSIPHLQKIEVYDPVLGICKLSDIEKFETFADNQYLSMRWTAKYRVWENVRGSGPARKEEEGNDRDGHKDRGNDEENGDDRSDEDGEGGQHSAENVEEDEE
ncbi:hypothetical protein TI39_contig357g00015 [Zymoseptoria brevis]|uniref:F-box domain-containing protein n=1 Tax=Zymoseptoria brevis TaxID=1047168 RepID=A0A0F4GQG0_9PEZI|nr:hypothetical protein TI39_contig357g00015 [Zymoseptoria brevis]